MFIQDEIGAAGIKRPVGRRGSKSLEQACTSDRAESCDIINNFLNCPINQSRLHASGSTRQPGRSASQRNLRNDISSASSVSALRLTAIFCVLWFW